MINILKNKNFLYFFSGTFASSIGDVLFNFAIGLYILHLTHSALQLSFYGMIGAVTWLVLTPLGGVYTDRWNRVKIIYITEFIRGIAVIGCGLTMVLIDEKQLILYVLYFTTFVIAVNGALFAPASQALVPSIVNKEDLLKANSLMSLTYSIKDVFGILLAGIMYAVLGPTILVFINGISYLLSGLGAMFIKENSIQEERKQTKNVFSELKEGIVYIISKNKPILWLLVMVNIINLANGPIQSVLLPFLMKEYIHAPEMHLSYLYSASALGGVCGTLILPKLKIAENPFKLLKIAFSIMFLAIISQFLFFSLYDTKYLSYTIYLTLLIVVFIGSGMLNITMLIPVLTYVQKVVNKQYYGRVMAIFSTLSAITAPISMMLGGFLIDKYSINSLYVFSTSVLFISFLLSLFIKGKQVNVTVEEQTM
ncbi:MFS transporter [Bacillus sp. EAC]|uniref:MFS transporter n=1 Tax=Bacillus sp. EAC TaxID=1978338 RepID=UPI000B450798|nr:MFS transporter [Bacillus sp. EAC]